LDLYSKGGGKEENLEWSGLQRNSKRKTKRVTSPVLTKGIGKRGQKETNVGKHKKKDAKVTVDDSRDIERGE